MFREVLQVFWGFRHVLEVLVTRQDLEVQAGSAGLEFSTALLDACCTQLCLVFVSCLLVFRCFSPSPPSLPVFFAYARNTLVK